MLRATDAAHVDAVTNWLRISARVGDITVCRTDTDLRSELADCSADSLPDFVVLVVSHPELPPYLLRYPDLRVLVLTTHRKVGSLTPWLQQGASDVASLARPHQVQHALGRLIDESAMERRVDLLATELLRSEARYTNLVRHSRTALSFWRDDELLSCSPSFADITGLSEGASTRDWLNGLDEQSRAELGEKLDDFPEDYRAAVRSHGQTIRIAREPSCDGFDDNEHLISVKLVLPSAVSTASAEALTKASELAADMAAIMAMTPSEDDDDLTSADATAINATSAHSLTLTQVLPSATAVMNTLPTQETDSVSGLPARQTVVNKFQRWLQRPNDKARYVAMTVELSGRALSSDTKSHTQVSQASTAASPLIQTRSTSPIDRTLQDLAVYRAADRLSRSLSPKTLLGRLSDNRLLIIRELDVNEAPRMLAKGIRRSLGSLGGLLGSPEAVRINTVNIIATQGASAEGLVSRLENR